MKICDQPVGRGMVWENRRCGALVVPGWKVCAAHLSQARKLLGMSNVAFEHKFRDHFFRGHDGENSGGEDKSGGRET